MRHPVREHPRRTRTGATRVGAHLRNHAGESGDRRFLAMLYPDPNGDGEPITFLVKKGQMPARALAQALARRFRALSSVLDLWPTAHAIRFAPVDSTQYIAKWFDSDGAFHEQHVALPLYGQTSAVNNRSGASVMPSMNRTDPSPVSAWSPVASFWDHLSIAIAQSPQLQDRVFRSNIERLRKSPAEGRDLYLNFYNLPPKVLGHGAGGGAEAENNRMMFVIRPVVGGTGYGDSKKVKIEMTVSALPREYRLRAKTGKPDDIASYLALFLRNVVQFVPPNYTHTRTG